MSLSNTYGGFSQDSSKQRYAHACRRGGSAIRRSTLTAERYFTRASPAAPACWLDFTDSFSQQEMSIYMPSAFDTRQKAHAYLSGKGGANARWTVRLGIERGGARHSLTNVYANGTHVGSFQLSTLGPAFYYHGKESGYNESSDIPLTWGQINDGLIMSYKTVFPWGPWICHDYTGYLFRTWGIAIKNDSATNKGLLYIGARAIGTVLWPGTGAAMAVHKGWNLAQDGARAVGSAISNGWNQLGNAFGNAARPGAWRWRLW